MIQIWINVPRHRSGKNGAQALGCAHVVFITVPCALGRSGSRGMALLKCCARDWLGIVLCDEMMRTVSLAATSSRTGQCDASRFFAPA